MGRNRNDYFRNYYLYDVTMESKQTMEQVLLKVDELRRSGKIDLSSDEDLSIAVMNLLSLEEHFFFTGSKTKKDEYFDLLSEVRENRKVLMARLVQKHEGETWCISKHLLATTIRLMEVGTKFHGEGKKEDAKEMFERAYSMYSMFWGLRLKLLNLEDIKTIAAEEKPWSAQDIVNKLVDCCNE